jgi:hypothetical protein
VEGRARVRDFLAGRATDRPPFLPLAIDFCARLEQTTRAELLTDPSLLTRGLLGAQELFGFDAIVIALAPDELEARPVVAEAVHRLRVLAADRAAVGLLLPGGREVDLLEEANAIGPQNLDLLGVVEPRLGGEAEAAELASALAPLWNVARYYAVPSLFAAAHGGPEAAALGSDAVSVWSGARPDELLAAGARRVGVPLRPEDAAPELPPGGFYTTAGELPAETDLDWLHAVVSEIAT